VAGGDHIQETYLNAIPRNMSAALDIGNNRIKLGMLAKGLISPVEYFKTYEITGIAVETMASHRSLGDRHVIILDDHDHVCGTKIRFGESANEKQILAATAIQFLCLGIPCIYYGTEQALASGPLNENEQKYLDGWKGNDKYLREALFGPLHPLKQGNKGRNGELDTLPGFGPFGTAGSHCFDTNISLYKKIGELGEIRKKYSPIRQGRQYLRQISIFDSPFVYYNQGGEITAWSRILDDQEILCVFNFHGNEERGARILVDSNINMVGGKLKLIFKSQNNWRKNEIEVEESYGNHYVELLNLPPSAVLLFTN
jgi:glycosidase